jgi:hypothetical protein
MIDKILSDNETPKTHRKRGNPRKLGAALYIILLAVFIGGCSKDVVKDQVAVDPPITATIAETFPADLADTVAINPVVAVTFKSATNPSAISASTISLMLGTVPVPGTVTFSGTTATFTPTAVLKPDCTYTATIKSKFKNGSSDGKSSHTWTFRTGKHMCGNEPTVVSVVPLKGSTSVAVTIQPAVTFSEAMMASTIDSATFTLKQGMLKVKGSVSYLDKIATFKPSGDLVAGLVYTATISKGVKNEKGIGLKSIYVWSFTTVGSGADVVAPKVLSVVPLNNAIGVAVNSKPAVIFSEAMNPMTINATTFTLKQGTTVVTGTVAYSGTTAIFTPTSSLVANLVYTGTVTTGAKDMAGNAIASNYVWSFTAAAITDVIAPTVLSFVPANNATLVAINSKATITFSEVMNSSTINATTVTLKQGTTGIAGTVAYSGTTATFTPTNSLAANTVYTGTVTTGAKDLAGNALAVSTVWKFTTASSATQSLAVVNLGAAANYVILAKSEITNIATSAINGDLGLSPAATSYMTGFALINATGYATSSQVTGKVYAADMVSPTPINLTTAVNNMLTAYTDAAGRPTPDFTELGTGNIGGKTLTPGLYKWTNTVTMPSDVVVSGGANDVWIFQIAGNLTMSAAVKITLTGGAQAKNIFWQVAGQVTLGTTSHFEGVILSKTGITLQTGASMNGRALAQTAVILDKNAVTQP